MYKKIIAPLVIGGIITIYLMIWICGIFWMDLPIGIHLFLGIPMTALLLLWIYIVRERLQEIRSGEEDDLSKY